MTKNINNDMFIISPNQDSTYIYCKKKHEFIIYKMNKVTTNKIE